MELETDGSGSALASYVLGGTELLSQMCGGATSYYLHDGQGSTLIAPVSRPSAPQTAGLQ